jgi:putative methyltransferase (TIGR04325 family)
MRDRDRERTNYFIKFEKIIKFIYYKFYRNLNTKYFSTFKECTDFCNKFNKDLYENNLLTNYRFEKYKKNVNLFPHLNQPSYKLLLEVIFLFYLKYNRFPKILDFGGAFGETAIYIRNLFGKKNILYCVVETKKLVDLAKSENLKFTVFYDSLDLAVKNFKPDIFFSSATLYYLEKPYEIIKKIFSTHFKYIALTRNLFSKDEKIFNQISLLSENGAGEHLISYKDRFIFYPATNLNKDKIIKISKNKYKKIFESTNSGYSEDLIFKHR